MPFAKFRIDLAAKGGAAVRQLYKYQCECTAVPEG